MAGDTHKLLVELGERWLKRQGFPIVAAELASTGTREQADVIGFRSGATAMIEAKASRADFLADARKPHRAAGGLGTYRFYLCPPEIIAQCDLPERWGLLYAEGRRVREVVCPPGNLWPGYPTSSETWSRFQHEADLAAERKVLFSIARRRSLSRSEALYEKTIQAEKRRAERLARETEKLAEENQRLRMALYLAERGLTADRQSPADLKAAIRRKIA